MSTRNLLLTALLTFWISGTALAFYWSNAQRLRPFVAEEQLSGLLQQLPRPLPDSPAKTAPWAVATLLHYRDPDCGCARVSDAHVQRIADAYATRGVRFVLVDPAAAAPAPGGAWSARLHPATPGLPRVPSSPAAVVLDRHGAIAYYGPYSEGAGCFSGNGRFVEATLERLLNGDQVQQFNLLATGCYCSWPGVG